MSKKEVWKPVIFRGEKPSVKYAVSNHGRFGVMLANGKIEVRKFKAQRGCYRYNYKINGSSRGLFVYKEVAKAFVPKPSPKHSMVIRIDHDYLNDRADNLRWVTPEQHRAHVVMSPNAITARKLKAIVKSPTARIFTEKSVKEVKKLIWSPKRRLTFKQIAEKYGVSEMQIYRIKNGELWYHVRVENEPEHARYKQNLKNLALLAKNSNQTYIRKR